MSIYCCLASGLSQVFIVDTPLVSGCIIKHAECPQLNWDNFLLIIWCISVTSILFNWSRCLADVYVPDYKFLYKLLSGSAFTVSTLSTAPVGSIDCEILAYRGVMRELLFSLFQTHKHWPFDNGSRFQAADSWPHVLLQAFGIIGDWGCWQCHDILS